MTSLVTGSFPVHRRVPGTAQFFAADNTSHPPFRNFWVHRKVTPKGFWSGARKVPGRRQPVLRGATSAQSPPASLTPQPSQSEFKALAKLFLLQPLVLSVLGALFVMTAWTLAHPCIHMLTCTDFQMFLIQRVGTPQSSTLWAEQAPLIAPKTRGRGALKEELGPPHSGDSRSGG